MSVPARSAPAGYVDAFCAKCRTDRLVPTSTYRCTICSEKVEPSSLPSVPASLREGARVETTTEKPAARVQLPAIREARRWGDSTDALLTALEIEEAQAQAAYDVARARLQTAKRAASALRQLRDMVTVDGVDQPVASRVTVKSGRWSREFDACTSCGTTEKKHARRGLCSTCDSRRTRGQDQ